MNEAEVDASYWSRINPPYSQNPDVERIAGKLIEYKRPQFAVHFLSHYTHGEQMKVSPALALEVLEQLIKITNESEIHWGDISYALSRLMSLARKAENIDESRIAHLELFLMQLLQNYGEGPQLLHRELSRNPDFFVEVIEIIYKSENEQSTDQASISDGKISIVSNLLESWQGCPGTKEDSLLDKKLLQDWVVKVRTKLSESGRGTAGDYQIGSAFAQASLGTDGVFPHEYIREIIENLSNQHLERGFETKIFNNRGVTSRMPTDGGGQERNLAERYIGYANQINNQYPRTAAMLRRIADVYSTQARQEDASAELTEDFWH